MERSRRWPFARWRWRHPRLARLVPRRLASALIWREALRDPTFVAAIERGRADMEAGRVTPWEAVRAALDPAAADITGEP